MNQQNMRFFSNENVTCLFAADSQAQDRAEDIPVADWLRALEFQCRNGAVGIPKRGAFSEEQKLTLSAL